MPVTVFTSTGGNASSASASTEGVKPTPSSGSSAASTARLGMVLSAPATAIAASAARGRCATRMPAGRAMATPMASPTSDSSRWSPTASRKVPGLARSQPVAWVQDLHQAIAGRRRCTAPSAWSISSAITVTSPAPTRIFSVCPWSSPLRISVPNPPALI